MATEFDFSKVAGNAMVRETLAEPKIAPVDENVRKLAQAYYDGMGPNKLHAGRYTFKTVEEANEFAAQLRRAGNFINLPDKATVRVKVDPEGTGEDRVVGWEAGKRRGKAPNGSSAS